MKEKSKYVAFSTQKGGVGKTTLTVLVASYLHYVKGFNVAVVDCDYPQYSIVEMRERDLKTVMEDDHYKLMAYKQRVDGSNPSVPIDNQRVATVKVAALFYLHIICIQI